MTGYRICVVLFWQEDWYSPLPFSIPGSTQAIYRFLGLFGFRGDESKDF
jgi:hypothetical protein